MPQMNIGNNKIHYLDDGTGPVLVIVHGTPSSSAEFAEFVDRVKTRYRCLALDHLGFGQSDKPANADYSLQAHTDRFRNFMDQKGIQKFHLLVHDFGGAIALPWAIENWDQIESLAIMNSWIWPLIETAPELKSQRAILGSAFMRWMYLYLNFSARVLVKLAWGQHRPLTKEKHRRYQAAFTKSSERWGTVGFLRALIDFGNPAWALTPKLKALPAKEIRIVWGEADPVIKTANLNRWRDIFPKAEVHVLPKVGHFVADEAPELVAAYFNNRGSN